MKEAKAEAKSNDLIAHLLENITLPMETTYNKIFFLIGASGAGKTTVAKRLEKMGKSDIQICYFDSIGVPSTEEMIKKYGSIEEWQRAKTKEWVEKIKRKYLNKKNVLLDAQTRPSFIKEVCEELKVDSYETILFDCSDEVRKQRLINRNQASLANEQMMNWAKYLRNACQTDNCITLDTSDLSIDQSIDALMGFLVRI